MTNNLTFSHKILLAASRVVIAAFSLFTLHNDYLQRNAIRDDLESYLRETGKVTSSTISNWLSGRILLVEHVAQSVARDSSSEALAGLLEQRCHGRSRQQAEPYVDAATSKLIITIATPAKSAGLVGGDLNLNTLIDIINSLDFGGIG
jgi:methyl-accepting chemotaxis protein